MSHSLMLMMVVGMMVFSKNGGCCWHLDFLESDCLVGCIPLVLLPFGGVLLVDGVAWAGLPRTLHRLIPCLLLLCSSCVGLGGRALRRKKEEVANLRVENLRLQIEEAFLLEMVCASCMVSYTLVHVLSVLQDSLTAPPCPAAWDEHQGVG